MGQLQDYATLPLPLTPVEKEALADYEVTITRGLNTFYEVGAALMAIKTQKLYRAEYRTFEEYCAEKWHIGHSRAYQLIEAAAIKENLSTTVDILPENERQMRELKGLEPDQQRQVWAKAVDTAPKGKITAQHIKDVRQQEIPMPEPEPPKMMITTNHPISVFIPPKEKPAAPIWKIEAAVREWNKAFHFNSPEASAFYLSGVKHRAYGWNDQFINIKLALPDSLQISDGDLHQAINNVLEQIQQSSGFTIGPIALDGWTCSGCDKHLIGGWRLDYASGKKLCMACVQNINSCGHHEPADREPGTEEETPATRLERCQACLGKCFYTNKGIVKIDEINTIMGLVRGVTYPWPPDSQKYAAMTANFTLEELRYEVNLRDWEAAKARKFPGPESEPEEDLYQEQRAQGMIDDYPDDAIEIPEHCCTYCHGTEHLYKTLNGLTVCLFCINDPTNFFMRDREKIVKSGLRLLKPGGRMKVYELQELLPMKSGAHSPSGQALYSFQIIEKFETKAAMQRRIKELEQDEHLIFESRV